MTKSVWGILSTARINAKLLAGARLSEWVEIAAVASRDRARAESHAREHGIERAYGSYEALLADPAIEAVYISLPNSLHVEWTVRALQAGKHVLCEKPLSRRPHEVEAAFDEAARAGRLLSEAFMWRHHPQTARLVQLVEAGAVGDLRLICSAFGFPLADLANVRMRPELDGGALMDVGCYCVSAARLLGGEPERVTAEQVHSSSGVDVRLAALMRLPRGVVSAFDCAMDVPQRAALEVIGSDGSLAVGDPWHILEPGIELRRDGTTERIPVERANSFRLELENVSDAIRGEAPLLLGREEALGQARAIEALYRSAAEGGAVRIV